MASQGFIKVWRKMLDSEVMQDDWLCRLWMWCMLKARFSEDSEGYGVQRGQFLTSRVIASDQLKVSPSKWHRGINRLQQLGCIKVSASKSNKQKTMITICNFITYQDASDDIEHDLNMRRTCGEHGEAAHHYRSKNGKKGKGKPTTKFDVLSLPLPSSLDGLAFRTAWSEWIGYRQERSLSLREATMRKQLEFLAHYGEAGAISILDESIRNGWAGLFEPKHSSRREHGRSEGFHDGLLDFVERGNT